MKRTSQTPLRQDVLLGRQAGALTPLKKEGAPRMSWGFDSFAWVRAHLGARTLIVSEIVMWKRGGGL